MSDSYGSGLDFGPGVAPAAIAPIDDNPAAVTGPQDSAPQIAPPTQQSESPSFGSTLRNILPGPSYKTPDPQAAPMDQASDLLKQRLERANSIATNPLAQIFAPEKAQAAREFALKGAEELQKIETTKQQQADIRTTARNWGLSNPNQFGPAATDTTLANEALRQWKDEGNFNAYKALSGASPEWKNRADLYMPDAMSKFGDHVSAVQKGIGALNGAASVNSEQAFQAARDKVVRENDLGALGIKEGSIPRTIDEWIAKRGSLEAQYNTARRTLNAFNARQDQLNQATPIADKKVGDQIEGTFQFGNGEAIPGFKAVSLPGYGDVQGVMGPPGSRDTANRGVTWSNAAPEQIKTVREQLNAEEVKGAVGKFKMARDFYNTAQNDKMYKSAAGTALLADELGAIGRDVAEGSKAAGTVGLTKMLEAKYGTVDTARNRLNLELSALKEWRSKGGETNPRLSPPSIEGIKAVAQFKYDQALHEAQDRISQPLETAGRYGMVLKNLGLDKALTDSPELRSTYDNALRQGNKELDSYPMVTIGDRRVLLPTGSNVPGAKVAPLNHGPEPTPQVPQPPQGAQPSNGGPVGGQPAPPISNPGGAGAPVQPQPYGTPQPGFNAPVQRADLPPATQPTPVTPPSSNPGGVPQPAAVAGQQINVSLPTGATPGFVKSLQRIESGNQRDPWKAGTPLSSASGAFQFINSTWKDNKPAGAPDRARDATPQQQAEALATFTAKNADALQKRGIPVDDTNLYIAHNLGAGGASSLLKAGMNDDARSVVGETAARNNPMFFKGKPTVATVLGRYQAEMAKGISEDVPRGPDVPPKSPPSAGGATEQPPSLATRVGLFMSGARSDKELQDRNDAEAKVARKMGSVAVDNAPAIGSTVGAVAGGLSPVPGGAAVGGGAGGGAGQVFKDYMQGNPQNPQEIAKQSALGAVLGVNAVGRPLLSAAARVAGVGGVEATDAAAKGEDVDALEAGVRGAAYGLGGEALGRFVSSAGAGAYKALSRYTTGAQKELSAHAGQLAEARATLASEQPKLPGDAGPNPKYEAAKKQADDATQAIKDHGQNPDDMVHAYEQAKAGVSAGEAAVLRKAATEKAATSQGYDQLRQDVRETGVGVPKANQSVPDGPLAQLRTADNMTGKVPEQFRPEAEHAEMLIKAPAKDWGEKWQQLQNAGTELIQKRMAFLQNADKPSADAMNNLFEGVRNQQKAVANYVYGPKEGPKVIAKLENLDQQYAKIMNATQGMDYGKMRSVLASGNTPERRNLEKNFREFAKDDPNAIRAFNAMKAGARGDWKTEAQLMVPVIAGEVAANLHGIPTVGAISAVVGGHRLYKLMQGYVNAKTLGAAVSFKDFLANEIRQSAAPGVAGSAAQRTVVQGQ